MALAMGLAAPRTILGEGRSVGPPTPADPAPVRTAHRHGDLSTIRALSCIANAVDEKKRLQLVQ